MWKRRMHVNLMYNLNEKLTIHLEIILTRILNLEMKLHISAQISEHHKVQNFGIDC